MKAQGVSNVSLQLILTAISHWCLYYHIWGVNGDGMREMMDCNLLTVFVTFEYNMLICIFQYYLKKR